MAELTPEDVKAIVRGEIAAYLEGESGKALTEGIKRALVEGAESVLDKLDLEAMVQDAVSRVLATRAVAQLSNIQPLVTFEGKPDEKEYELITVGRYTSEKVRKEYTASMLNTGGEHSQIQNEVLGYAKLQAKDAALKEGQILGAQLMNITRMEGNVTGSQVSTWPYTGFVIAEGFVEVAFYRQKGMKNIESSSVDDKITELITND